ncbi:MAG: hypothetical protein DRR42_27050 [Gammaproteobacteria bacterium]|nr:MAG: hypothetical protein DRR42_27050 [Gammaproteobacteria bacterium]
MYGDFFLLEQENEDAVRAERLAFGETAGRNEAWLRDTLFEHPEILPIREVDPSFGPLIPLCKELRTDAGPLDIAYINPLGQLTLVECKLWRNPEARRKVVAQVLDYVRAISRWSYADLQRQVSAATGIKGNVPFELAKAQNPELEERRFVDETHAAIKAGRFLLLIAGDGIREDVGAMAELINRNAASGFTFGLVEVALYGLEEGGLIVQPRVIAKTKNIERTVVLVRDSDSSHIVVQPMDDEPGAGVTSTQRNELGESPKQAEYRKWWAPVLDMTFDDPEQEPPQLFYPNNVRIALPWPNMWILMYCMANGRTGICTAGRKGADQPAIEGLESQREEILAELPEGAEFVRFHDSAGFTYRMERKSDEFESEDQNKDWLIQAANRYVNALRPRLNNLLDSQPKN